MATAYTPGLKVVARVSYRLKRLLPIPGEVLVALGETVLADKVVARTDLPGDVVPLNVAHQLGIAPAEVPAALVRAIGSEIATGDPLARSAGLFGWFPQTLVSPAAGRLESASQVTGQVMLRGAPRPVQVRAHVAGQVVEIIPHQGVEIESLVSQVQGIFGLGGETRGRLAIASKPGVPLAPQDLNADHRGAVVVTGGRISLETIHRAIELGVSAILAGGIDDSDLRSLLGYDLGVAVTGTESIGLTLVITEGFGDIPMSQRTFDLLSSRAGAMASVSGATQIRAGVLRPEIVIPWENSHLGPMRNLDGNAPSEPIRPVGLLQVGASIRLIRDPWFGAIGMVAELPHEPQWLESGSKARVLIAALADGQRVVVPRANVELIETEAAP
jgi:hypothetical protein